MLKALDHGRLFGREEVNPRFGVNLRESRISSRTPGSLPVFPLFSSSTLVVRRTGVIHPGVLAAHGERILGYRR